MIVLGITGFNENCRYDSSAAILKDGVVVAAFEQEKLSRRLHAKGELPIDAIEYCLKKTDINLQKIDAIAIGWKEDCDCKKLTGNDAKKFLINFLPESFTKDIEFFPPIYFVKHNIANIASAFFQSGFEEAACLTIDGLDETTSITLAKTNKKKDIKIIKTFPIASSLKIFLESACAYCGLNYEVSKTEFMDLANFGNSNQHMPLSFMLKSGNFKNDIKEINNSLNAKKIQEFYINYFIKNNYPYQKNSDIKQLICYSNFAKSIQNSLEDIIFNLIKFLKKKSKLKNLVISDEVLADLTNNSNYMQSKIFENIFINPISNNTSSSIGAALYVMHNHNCFKNNLPNRVKNFCYGITYSSDIINIIMNNPYYNITHFTVRKKQAKRIAELLLNNKIVVCYDNNTEFGLSSIGHRNILANPNKREMLYKMNMLKNRNIWRPLSCLVLDKYCSEVFLDFNIEQLEFIPKVAKIKEKWLNKIPAIVYNDYKTKVQLLKQSQNPLLYNIMEEFYILTGIPVLINLPLNLEGQPVIETPRDVLNFFEQNEKIDYLVIDEKIISLNK